MGAGFAGLSELTGDILQRPQKTAGKAPARPHTANWKLFADKNAVEGLPIDI
jgi:hypothetical protein